MLFFVFFEEHKMDEKQKEGKLKLDILYLKSKIPDAYYHHFIICQN